MIRRIMTTLAVLNASGKIGYDKSGETARARGDTRGLEEIFIQTR